MVSHRGKNGSADPPDHAQVLFHPPLLLVAALGSAYLMERVVPLPFLPPGWPATLGPAVTAASFAIFVWAVYTMATLAGKTSLPTGEPTNVLVERGPYRLSRNPIYLAMVLLQIGVGLWRDSVWYPGLAALSVILFWWGVISREERYLERKFGDAYVSYTKRVRRWI